MNARSAEIVRVHLGIHLRLYRQAMTERLVAKPAGEQRPLTHRQTALRAYKLSTSMLLACVQIPSVLSYLVLRCCQGTRLPPHHPATQLTRCVCAKTPDYSDQNVMPGITCCTLFSASCGVATFRLTVCLTCWLFPKHASVAW